VFRRSQLVVVGSVLCVNFLMTSHGRYNIIMTAGPWLLGVPVFCDRNVVEGVAVWLGPVVKAHVLPLPILISTWIIVSKS
jgi:hypothetical protein